MERVRICQSVRWLSVLCGEPVYANDVSPSPIFANCLGLRRGFDGERMIEAGHSWWDRISSPHRSDLRHLRERDRQTVCAGATAREFGVRYGVPLPDSR